MTDTLLLRALAALLIANSHLEDYYPNPRLAADGLLGDTLFFALSGYGLALSAKRNPRGFLEWYARRVSRIFPALILVLFTFYYVPARGWRAWSAFDYFFHFAWGGPFPFIGQILVFYALFYWLLRRPGAIGWIITCLFIPWLALPWLGRGPHDAYFHAFHWLFYFQAMLLGAALAMRSESDGRPWTKLPLALPLVGFCYLAARAGVAVGPLRAWYFLPHLCVLPLVVLIFAFARSAIARNWLEQAPLARQGVAFLGGLSLELYLMHYQVLPLQFVRSLVFPVNVLLFFALSILGAHLLSWIARRPSWPHLAGQRLAAPSGRPEASVG